MAGGRRSFPRLLQSSNVLIRVSAFDPLVRFCPETRCIYTEDGQVLYQDSNHLSRYGSERYREAFTRWLTSPGQ